MTEGDGVPNTTGLLPEGDSRPVGELGFEPAESIATAAMPATMSTTAATVSTATDLRPDSIATPLRWG